MSMPKPSPTPNANEVADYLESNPAFFDAHQELLARMHLPEPPEVDERIQQRQVEVLQERQDLQQARLDLMVDTVRNNQALARELHRIAVVLLGRDAGDAIDADAMAAMARERFNIDEVVVFLRAHADEYVDVEYALLCQRVQHFGSVCDDRVSSKLSAAFFPSCDTMTSCAFIPLAQENELYGVMVLGSIDKQRFQPDMGVLILDRLGQLLGAYLAGCARV